MRDVTDLLFFENHFNPEKPKTKKKHHTAALRKKPKKAPAVILKFFLRKSSKIKLFEMFRYFGLEILL